jgi:hypothetical protein
LLLKGRIPSARRSKARAKHIAAKLRSPKAVRSGSPAILKRL